MLLHTHIFDNQLVYEEVLSWLGFAFASDGRENSNIYVPDSRGSRTATADDFADDAVYGVNQAQTLIRRHSIHTFQLSPIPIGE